MKINFKNLEFVIVNDKILLVRCGNLHNETGFPFVEIQLAGENKCGYLGNKMVHSSESGKLYYISHEISDNQLIIRQRSDLIEAITYFDSFDGSDAVRVHTEIRNISDEEQIVEEVSAFVVTGIGNSISEANNLYFTRFIQSHHAECQPKRFSFPDLGLYRVISESQKRISFANVGSWSTNEELPQGIIEDTANGKFAMFQIESNNSWYYEIADVSDKYYLYLGGANMNFGGWCKKLQPGESYCTVNVALAFSDSLNGVLAEMTKYRRNIRGMCRADEELPCIYNEYMHLSWDSPEEKNTKVYAPVVAKTGVDYYVIDCGWHDEEDGSIIYPYVGRWRESNKRFPSGVRAMLDYIRSLGLKPGLWIEPEVIGCKCSEMLEYYDDDCFLQRNGKRLCALGRHFLDYRAPKVREYMTETIRRMVEDYGAEYIKFDYNQDCGVGTDLNADSCAEGLEQTAKAFLSWVDEIRERYPDVLFEACASGGMRMDYKTLSHFSIISTSDQVDYKKYPYIAGNILSAVLPEQAAVWSYPVDNLGKLGIPFTPDDEYVKQNVSEEKVIMNMINCFLGRMHLASHLELLPDEMMKLVREGVEYHKSMNMARKTGVPYMPLGFTKFGEKLIASGLKTDDKLYLAVWNMGNKGSAEIELKGLNPASAEVAYPKNNDVSYKLENNILRIDFNCEYQARMFEIDLR